VVSPAEPSGIISGEARDLMYTKRLNG